MDKIIFHIDVNSAFLSWSAVDALNKGADIDIRNIPSVIGGDESSRRGVVLAKSVPAKAYGIITGESLFSARRKCPNIEIISPCFHTYEKYSRAMMEMLSEYTPTIEQYSIDECFLQFSKSFLSEPVKFAEEIKERIKKELGFTVNIGISNNKLLAKMASELNKPDKVNTIYPSEIKEKMWPLQVEELFMVGKKAKEKLNKMYIYTIGDLANYNVSLLKDKFKSYGELIWQYSNGIDHSEVAATEGDIKVISNSTTLAADIIEKNQANKVLFSLVENVAARLRKSNKCCSCIAVSIRSSEFKNYSHQKKLMNPTDSTERIAETVQQLFDETWKREPIRLLGVSLSHLSEEGYYQLSLFESGKENKNRALDNAIDSIRNKYGDNVIKRFGSK